MKNLELNPVKVIQNIHLQIILDNVQINVKNHMKKKESIHSCVVVDVMIKNYAQFAINIHAH